ncbi:MAG: hypothetical protein L0Y71_11725 [Gemmataceae bacterium]|nr:hypothetical protein [Gemmataceae bacterium]
MFRIGTVSVLLTLLVGSCCIGQSRPVSEFLVNATPEELRQIGQRCLIYVSDGEGLQFSPFYAFEFDEQKKLKLHLSHPIDEGSPWELQLGLLVSPDCLLDPVAHWVNEWAARLPEGSVNKRYATINRTSLLPCELIFLTVEEMPPPGQKPLFQCVERTEKSMPQRVVLSSYFSSRQEAERVADRLTSGAASLRFRVKCGFHARHTNSKSTVRVTSTSINKTKGLQEVNGAGRPFVVQLGGQSQTMQMGDNRVVLTRYQFEKLKAQLKNEIAEEYFIDNKEDLSFLERRVEARLSEVLSPESIPLDSLKAGIRHLSAYAIDPRDLSPDRIQQVAHEQKDYLASKDYTRRKTAVSAGGSFLGIIGGHGSSNQDFEEDRQRMIDAGWRFGTKGEYWVPKSLDVRVGIDRSIRINSDILITVNRGSRAHESLETQISTREGFLPQKLTPPQNLKIQALEKRLSKLEARNTEPEKQLPVATGVFVSENDGYFAFVLERGEGRYELRGADGRIGTVAPKKDGTFDWFGELGRFMPDGTVTFKKGNRWLSSRQGAFVKLLFNGDPKTSPCFVYLNGKDKVTVVNEHGGAAPARVGSEGDTLYRLHAWGMAAAIHGDRITWPSGPTWSKHPLPVPPPPPSPQPEREARETGGGWR